MLHCIVAMSFRLVAVVELLVPFKEEWVPGLTPRYNLGLN
ncbi:hypothetical protein Nmel_005106 [Mimus melanotis]